MIYIVVLISVCFVITLIYLREVMDKNLCLEYAIKNLEFDNKIDNRLAREYREELYDLKKLIKDSGYEVKEIKYPNKKLVKIK